MPKLAVSLLTLLVALLYGVCVVTCPSGVLMHQDDVCAAPVGEVCVTHGIQGCGAVQEGGGNAGAQGQGGCDTCLNAEQCCWAEHVDVQVGPMNMARVRLAPPMLCVLAAMYGQPERFKPARWEPAEGCGVWGSDLAQLRSTQLLI